MVIIRVYYSILRRYLQGKHIPKITLGKETVIWYNTISYNTNLSLNILFADLNNGVAMKRKFALLLFLLLTVVTVLSACNSVPATGVAVRWAGRNESHTFRISLADFQKTDADTNKPTNSFAVYKDDDGKDYRKDVSPVNEVFSALDEIRPVAVDGTYVINISSDAANSSCTATTEQTIYAQYAKVSVAQNGTELNLPACDNWEQLAERLASPEEIAATSLTEADDKVIFKSTSRTSVTFSDNTQQPISSSSEVHGFYIGLLNQQVSEYKLQTTYDFSNSRKPVVKVVCNDVEKEYALARNTSIIDANQLLLYVRSLEKTSTSFQDTPSVRIFNSLTGETLPASFSFTYDFAAVITDPSRTEAPEKHVSMNIVYATVNGHHYMVQENIPDAAGIDKTNAGTTPMYTTNRFRVGYLAYELDSYTDAIWNALKPSYGE